MRFTTSSVFAIAAASSAIAQTSSPLTLGKSLLGYLSPSCQATLLPLILTNSTFASCVNVNGLLPSMLFILRLTTSKLTKAVLSSNGSIVPPLDTYLGEICSSAPCSNETLTNATQTIMSGCASDFSKFGLSNSTVMDVFGLYPMAREVACLKTTLPFNGTNATIPISNSTYNSTNGTFCVTSVLTEVSAYLGVNLTNSFVDTVILGGNATALQSLEMIPPSALCSDCVFAALDLVGQEYPQVGMINLSSNYTVGMYLNGTCNATGFNYTTNGTLPLTIQEVAFNSSYPYNVTIGNLTYPAGLNSSAPPSLNGSVFSVVSSKLAGATSGASVSAPLAAATSA
ncbi:MAG: hypothetical protein TREMPRED_004540 [Tremellales sp. Tagirdzhanova-0007]|nr:MAG: hypothetical protein TREMPRED_004540 [Tremellales sp. Tagirdzhanova-0007]